MPDSRLRFIYGDEHELADALLDAVNAMNYARLSALQSDVLEVEEVMKAARPIRELLKRLDAVKD